MESKERELQEHLDACVQEKNELEQGKKRSIVELEKKIRLMESRNLSLKRYSSGLRRNGTNWKRSGTNSGKGWRNWKGNLGKR